MLAAHLQIALYPTKLSLWGGWNPRFRRESQLLIWSDHGTIQKIIPILHTLCNIELQCSGKHSRLYFLLEDWTSYRSALSSRVVSAFHSLVVGCMHYQRNPFEDTASDGRCSPDGHDPFLLLAQRPCANLVIHPLMMINSIHYSAVLLGRWLLSSNLMT